MSSPVTLVATVGDPRGIGPEVMPGAARAALEEDPSLRCVILGWVGPVPFTHDRLTWEETPGFDGSARGAGRLSLAAIEAGVGLCMRGKARGLVTGPVHKAALRQAGAATPGQTELLAELTGARRVGMLMASEEGLLGHPLRVLLATTHIPLREVPARVTAELLVEQTDLLADALTGGWGISSPTIALCALNPHASDEGLFGDEEGRVFQPAVERLRAGGVDITGPIPADTVFRRAALGEFDAVVAPYHDVGMAAFKSLPFPRTSPDHGTAFDIAGLGRADPASALAAFRLAGRLARVRS
jgi:4-hydroxythreonine-4-phosphate dehydrogenase